MDGAASIREAHEAFVTDHKGSTAIDVILGIFPIIPASLLASCIVQGRTGWPWFMFESLAMVLPPTLGFTVLADYTLELSATVIFLSGLVLLCLPPSQKQSYPCDKKHLACVTSMRGILNVNTSIAILGVDFHSFPRRFAKTEEYGYGVMDVGAGGFVVANGFVESRKKRCPKIVMRDAASLALLGFARLIMVWLSDYQHHVTEYGLHSNFFFILAFIKATCSWWVYILNVYTGTALALLICWTHHLLLTSGGLAEWTLSGAGRDTLLAANRETVVAMPGYVAIYLFGAALGNYTFTRWKEGKPLTLPFFVCVALSGGCLAFLGHFVGVPSRRLCNATFVALVMTYTSIGFASFSLIEETLSPTLCVPPVLAAVNERALFFFVLANLGTGLVNKSINTLDIEYPVDLCIISTYGILIISVVYVLYCYDKTRRGGDVIHRKRD